MNWNEKVTESCINLASMLSGDPKERLLLQIRLERFALAIQGDIYQQIMPVTGNYPALKTRPVVSSATEETTSE